MRSIWVHASTYGDVESDTWEETTLGDTKECAGDEEAGVGGDKAHERHAQAPGDHAKEWCVRWHNLADFSDLHGGKPEAGTRLLEHHVRWDLGGDVEGEEDGCKVIGMSARPAMVTRVTYRARCCTGETSYPSSGHLRDRPNAHYQCWYDRGKKAT